jgi:hypothetical protein
MREKLYTTQISGFASVHHIFFVLTLSVHTTTITGIINLKIKFSRLRARAVSVRITAAAHLFLHYVPSTSC